MLEGFEKRSLTIGPLFRKVVGGLLISRKSNVFLIFSLLFFATELNFVLSEKFVSLITL